MAIIGDAYVVVRAITTNVLPDIQKGLSGVGGLGEKAGQELGQGINSGLRSGGAESGFKNLSDRLEASRVKFRGLNNAVRFLGPAITGLIGAIGALVGGLIVLVAAAGSASRALIVLPAAFGSLIQALLTTKFLLGGVGAAVKALAKSQKEGANATKAEEAALRRLRDARLALKRLLEEEAPEQLAAAREKAADAARSAADALLSAERAQRGYNEAQLATLQATNAVTEAREQAIEKLQQLRFAVEGAAISEAKARLEFEKSRDSLQAVQDLPPNSRARQEAELAFAQAELNLRKAIDNNSDLKKEENAASRAGVEGSKDVLSAKEDLAAAQQREVDLAIDVARAFQAAAEAQKDAAQAAADAAIGGSVERDLNRRIAEAREAVRDAEKDAADAKSGASSAVADAYKGLNKAGITLAQTIARLQVKFVEFRKEISTPLLTLLNSALLILEANFREFGPVLEETGRIVGQLALDFAETFLQGEGLKSLKRVFSTNNVLLEKLGGAALNLAQAFIIILEAAEPLITAFGDWAESKSASFLADLSSDSNGLSETFANAQRNFVLFASIFDNFFGGLGAIGRAVNEPGGAAQTLLEDLETKAINFNETLNGMADDGSLNTMFQGLSDNFIALFELATELGRVFLEIGQQPGIGQFIDSIKGAVTNFGDVGVSLSGEDGPVAKLGEFIEKFSELVLALTDAESLNAFFGTLNMVLDGVLDIVTSDAFQEFFLKWGPVIAQVAAFGLAFRSVKFIAEAFLGTILLLFAPFLGLAGLLTKGVGGALGGFLGTLKPIFGLALRLFGIFGLIVGAIMLAWENSQYFRDSVYALWDGIKSAFSEVSSAISGIFEDVAPSFSRIGEVLGEIFGTLVYIVTPIITTIIKIVGGGIAVVIALFAGILDAFSFIWYGIKGIIQTIVALFTGEWDGAIESFKKAWEGLKGFFKNVITVIFRPIFLIINKIIDAWNNMAKNLVIRVPDWVPFIGGGTFQLPQIRKIAIAELAKGGVVPATYGGMLARIGEAGRPERVEPLDPDGLSKRDKAMIDRLSGGGSGGATINVYPSPGMDERELAEMVSRKLAYQMRKGSI
jgi:phage-related protein